jgi:dipeptidyl-peptidase 4
MKKYNILLLFVFVSQFTFAQKKTLTIEDTGNPAFRAKPLSQLSFNFKGDAYTFIEKDNLISASIVGETRETKLSLAKLNEVLKAQNEAELKNFPGIEWQSENSFLFVNGSKQMSYDFTTSKITTLNTWNENAENIDMATNKNVAYTIKGNLFIQKAGYNKINWQSKEDGYNTVVGESVHRQEFGISKGTFWSPNGNRLAFYRMNQSMVSDYPLADYRLRTAKGRTIKYPMAGEKSHHVTVGIWDAKKNKVKFLETGEPAEQYLTNLTWSPDEKYLYIQVLNRDQNYVKLNCYDVKSGKLVKTLLEEKHDKFVEPLHELLFLPKNPSQFIYQTQKDGFNHLYLYDTDGKEIKQITRGNWVVLDILGFDAEGKNVYITSTEVSPLEVNAYKVNLENGQRTRLTPSTGVHAVSISKNDRYVLDNFSNLKTPLKTTLNDINGLEIKTLHKIEDLLANYETGETSFMTLKTEDGKADLYARMIKPANFDPTKKYPVLWYVYNGPHVQLVQNRWLGGADMFLEFMASQGYVVFTIDGRGSYNRGRDFENAVHRNLGTIEIEDQMVGVEYLKNQPYVDASRMVCFGWSYGGFMTTSMLLKKPNVFKVGIAGGPVIDWKFYEIMYTERYMDTPEQNPDGYKAANLTNSISNLKGKLSVIQGLEDDTVVPQHAYSLVNEAIAKGIVFDFYPYPNHPHNVRGKDRIHLYKKIYDYIQRNN